MGNCNHENLEQIYSHRENARRITIPEARKIPGSICYGRLMDLIPPYITKMTSGIRSFCPAYLVWV